MKTREAFRLRVFLKIDTLSRHLSHPSCPEHAGVRGSPNDKHGDDHMACKKTAQCACACTAAKKPAKAAATAKLPTQNAKLIAWVSEIRKLCQPKNVVWCDGSKKEYKELCDLMVEAGVFTKLNPGSARAATSPARTHRMWRASKTAPTSPRRSRLMPARATTGAIRMS